MICDWSQARAKGISAYLLKHGDGDVWEPKNCWLKIEADRAPRFAVIPTCREVVVPARSLRSQPLDA